MRCWCHCFKEGEREREREKERERESDEEQRHFFFFWVWKRKEFEILREVFGGVESCLGIHEMRWNIYVLNIYSTLVWFEGRDNGRKRRRG